MRYKFISLLTLTGMILSSCRTLPPAWSLHPVTDPSKLMGKSTVVVPVQGAAIAMQDSQIGTAILGGIVGVAIKEHLVDKPRRDALRDGIGACASEFSPEVVLAEECVRFLNQAHPSSSSNATLFHGLEKMPGLTPEIARESRPFRTTNSVTELGQWEKAYDQWLISGPFNVASANKAGGGRPVSLELTVVHPLLKGQKLYLGVFMRLMDPVSGQSIASGFMRDEFSVHRIKSAADIDAFVADYRNCARQLSGKLLKQLNLIP